MTSPENQEDFSQLVQKIHPQGKLIGTWPLEGGVSAQTTALEVQWPDGTTQKLVVRQHGERDLRRNPHVAEDEFTLLKYLSSKGLAVPKPYFADSSDQILSSPFVVVEFVQGITEFEPEDLDAYVTQFTTHLANIHQVDCSQLDLSKSFRQVQRYEEKIQHQPKKFDDAIEEGRVRDILKSNWPWTQTNETALLHGDFWPGNLLWRDGQLAAVIDWEDAHFGDPLSDVAISRAELAIFFGVSAMERFTEKYQSIHPLDLANLPYWDLYAVLRYPFNIPEWAEDKQAERKMLRELNAFIQQALEKIS